MHLTRVDFEVFWNPASEEHFDATTASISLYKALTRILINDLKVLVRQDRLITEARLICLNLLLVFLDLLLCCHRQLS